MNCTIFSCYSFLIRKNPPNPPLLKGGVVKEYDRNKKSYKKIRFQRNFR